MIRSAAVRVRESLPFAVAALFLAVAIAALGWLGGRSPGEPPLRVILVDVSRSVGSDADAILADLDGAIRSAAAGAGESLVTVLAFDGAVRPLVDSASAREVADRGIRPRALSGERVAATDAGAAVDAALARIGGGAGDVVLLSDFAETRGDAAAAAARAAAAGVAVHAAALLPPALPDARVLSIDAPAAAPAGERVVIAVTVASRLPGERGARVDLSRDGVAVASSAVRLRGGDLARADFTDALPAAAGVPVAYLARVTLDPDGARDAFPENDALEAIVRTKGPPRVLVPRPGGALAAALAASGCGVAVTDRIDRAALAGADAVAIEDVPLGPAAADAGGRALTSAEAEAIAEFVAAGGALVAAGAERAFGPGLWRGTPLEAALPVECVPRDRPPLSLLLLLDVSGSMDAEGKLDRAREAAHGVLAALHESDRAGLIAFRDGIAAEAPFAPRAEAAASFARVLAPLEARGGTRLARAVAAALAALAPERGERHLIVLSDGLAGESGDGGDEPLPDLARRASEAGITVSVIATGADVDSARLRSLGRVTVARDPSSIGRRFLEDLGRRDLAPGERTVSAGPDFDAAGASPEPFEVALLARTTPKPRARTVLATAAGDPVLAQGRSGSGSAVAIPVGFAAGGGARVLSLALPLVLERLRDAASLRGAAVSASYERAPEGLRVTVRGYPAGAPFPSRARSEPGGGSAPVRPIAPGRFEATLAEPAAGDVVFDFGPESPGGEAALRLPLPAFPPREFLAATDPIGGADRVARAGGGRVAPAGRLDRLPPPPETRSGRVRAPEGTSASAVLLAGALALLVAEAVVRARRRVAPHPVPLPLTSVGPSRR